MFTDLDDLATALYVTRDDFLVAHRSLSRCETPAEPPRSLEPVRGAGGAPSLVEPVRGASRAPCRNALPAKRRA